MSRLHGSAYLLIILAPLSVGAFATPISGAGFSAAHSFSGDGARVYNSSLAGAGSEQNHVGLSTGNTSFVGMRPHQLSLQVAPPHDSETPEPSTLTLFGSGLMLVGAAVRRKFGR